jgi:crotonobetainyl-CoA:carnitine CoA-transferase CaiB-like acyl-CoA transferase
MLPALFFALELHDASSVYLVYYYRKKEYSRGANRRIFTEESMEKPDTTLPQEGSEGALASVLVMDLTTARSGPTCTKILADFGADVVRIERPGDSESERVFYDRMDLHRNKKSVVLNLQDPQGIGILKRLASQADVFVENYRPGVKHRLGIDYETLSRDNQRLIYASISGFGQEGPNRDRPGYDQIIQGMSGLMWLTGTAESAPLRVGIPISDLLAGYFCAMGILLALYERKQSGRGQYVATSLLEVLVGSLSFQGVKYLNTGEVPPPVGNHHPLTAPMGSYRTKDGFMNLAVGNNEMWRRLSGALGMPELAEDPRFAHGQARVKNRHELDAILIQHFSERTVAEWVGILNEAAVACGPIQTLDQVFADPQVRRTGLVHEQFTESSGNVKVLGVPVFLSQTPPSVRTPAADPGAHTREVLSSLGYAHGEIDALAAAGVIGVRP